jgi:hypothetical protein
VRWGHDDQRRSELAETIIDVRKARKYIHWVEINRGNEVNRRLRAQGRPGTLKVRDLRVAGNGEQGYEDRETMPLMIINNNRTAAVEKLDAADLRVVLVSVGSRERTGSIAIIDFEYLTFFNGQFCVEG